MDSPDTERPPDAPHAPMLYGKYQLLERLARGGMAEVYKAKAHGVEGFEKLVVIKRILPELACDEHFVEMFINEAKIAVSLSHANIVQVFDLGQAEDSYFIAMEYVAGADLAAVLRRAARHSRPLPFALAVYIASEVAKALDYAHRRKDGAERPLRVVHQDISPQNVLVSAEGEVKLTDFGIARARINVPRASSLRGKYAYMSPEQARGDRVDHRSDLFALGAVLYECLTGIRPFEGETQNETLERVRTCTYDRIATVAPELPEALCTIIDRTLQAHPDDRYEDAGRLYEDLVQVLYTSGQRAGARELASYLTGLGTTQTHLQERRSSWLRLAFTDPDSSAGNETTPVEVPKARRERSEVHPIRTGEVLLPDRPRAERRDVTMMALGPVDAPRFPRELARPLRRLGGRLLSDRASLGWWHVLFGLDEPDGRDTEWAARYFLTLRKNMMAGAVSVPALHVGIHSGRVLVDAKGSLVRDERHLAMVAASTNAAELAQPGQGLMTAEAERNVRRVFELRQVQGTDCWTVVQERDVDHSRGRFVGRRDELRQFGRLLGEANRGKVRVIALVGEPGSGKSRFLAEALRRLRLGGHDASMFIARVPKGSASLPYSTIFQMLRVLLGIEETDSEPVVRHKASRLRELGIGAVQRAAIEALVGIQPDVETAVSLRNMRIEPAVQAVASKLAQDRLTLFAYDGADGADAETLELLLNYVKRGGNPRGVLVLTHRPGTLQEWTQLPEYHAIELDTLGDEHARELALSLLSAVAMPEPLMTEVLDKSQGNPLYIEEYLRALQDAGAIEIGIDGHIIFRDKVASVQVPRTLRGIVSARLASLDPTARHLVQLASLIEGSFGAELMATIRESSLEATAQALSNLEAAGLLRRVHKDEYQTAHGLVTEVVRDGLALESRRSLHRQVAEALEAHHAERIGEVAERIAVHFREAGLNKKAVHYLVRAADRLESEHALLAAVEHLEQAVELLSLVPSADRERRLQLYAHFGDLALRSLQFEKGAARMIAALELADGAGRDDYVARFSMLRGRLLSRANRIQESREWLARAREVAQRHGDPELIREVVVALADAEARVGNFGDAVQALLQACELARVDRDHRSLFRSLLPLAWAHGASGDAAAALGAIAEARSLIEGVAPDGLLECELSEAECLVHHYVGAREEAIRCGERALELAKEFRVPQAMANAAYYVAQNHLRLGHGRKAFALLRYCHDVAREHDLQRMEELSARMLGFLDVSRNRSITGRDRIAEAARFAEEQGYADDLVQGKYLLAYADHLLGRNEDALDGFRAVFELSKITGNVLFERVASEAVGAMTAGRPVELPR